MTEEEKKTALNLCSECGRVTEENGAICKECMQALSDFADLEVFGELRPWKN